MPILHYGPWIEIYVTAQECQNVMDAAGAHATRGGWVTLTDADTRRWSLLISAGIPMWVSDHQADPLRGADSIVQIRNRLLDEIDGPMLRHGLQDHHGKPLMQLPRHRSDLPDPERLAERWAEFLAA